MISRLRGYHAHRIPAAWGILGKRLEDHAHGLPPGLGVLGCGVVDRVMGHHACRVRSVAALSKYPIFCTALILDKGTALIIDKMMEC